MSRVDEYDRVVFWLLVGFSLFVALYACAVIYGIVQMVSEW